MNKEELLRTFQDIVKKAKELKDKYTNAINVKATYACICCQSDDKYIHLIEVAKEPGVIVQETLTGPFFNIQPLKTVLGTIKLIKIRKYDKEHLNLGYVDLTLDNYDDFKKEYLGKDGFKLIKRETFEMIELMEKEFEVIAYFANRPLEAFILSGNHK